MDKKNPAIIFTTIAVVLVIFTLLGPWYNFQLDIDSNINELDMNYSLRLYLSNANFQGQIFGRNVFQSEDYENIRDILYLIPGNSENDYSINQVFDVFETIRLFVIISLVLSITTFFVYALSVLFTYKDNNLRHLKIILGVIFSCFSFFSFFYFLFLWSSVIQRGLSLFLSSASYVPISSEMSEAGFWFSFYQGGLNITMGPGHAWYIMIISGIFGLIAVVLTLKSHDSGDENK